MEEFALQVPDERLRQVCAPMDEALFGSAQLYRWIEKLNQARSNSRGIGIAAPQLGLLYNLIVVDIPVKDWLVFGQVDAVPFHALLNPQIISVSAETVKAVESCLSVQGYQGFVRRPLRIGVVAYTPEGQMVEFAADGIYARCLQHEIDHLHGILYPDLITDLRDIQKVQAVAANDPVLLHNGLLAAIGP